MSNSSTIAAVSTAPGVGGIAVVRLSGPEAWAIASRRCPKLGVPTEPSPQPLVRFCQFFIPDTSSPDAGAVRLLDEVVATLFPQGHSYTGEPVAEFSCHGSLYVQQQLLQSLIDDGARLAEPGEFTRRAFLNGRLNLSQAEAVADLIEATTSASHALAISQLRGGYAQRLHLLRQQMVELTALLELELDFSDEDVEFADRSRLLMLTDTVAGECRRLVESFQWGNAVKNGVPVAIVGAPNVGKSTLLNALVGDERAIVSNIPGTTRDTIEDSVSIGGVLFRFIDTAGIRQHTTDVVEAEGIRRSMQAVQRARIVLFLSHEGADCGGDEGLFEQVASSGAKVLRIATKSDLSHRSQFRCDLSLSAKTGEGIDSLKQLLVDTVVPCMATDDVLLTNLRHYEALQRVCASLQVVREGLETHLSADLVVIDLREALYHLGTITGEVTSDEVLGTIFSRFCIGK